MLHETKYFWHKVRLKKCIFLMLSNSDTTCRKSDMFTLKKMRCENFEIELSSIFMILITLFQKKWKSNESIAFFYNCRVEVGKLCTLWVLGD